MMNRPRHYSHVNRTIARSVGYALRNNYRNKRNYSRKSNNFSKNTQLYSNNAGNGGFYFVFVIIFVIFIMIMVSH